MKTSAKIIQSFCRHSRAVLKLLDKPATAFHAEDYHVLRVHIKKIKAIFLLANACVDSFQNKKLFKPFKAIFRQAGIIRGLQLHQALLSKYKADPARQAYDQAIANSLAQHQLDFFNLVQKKQKKKIRKNIKDVVSGLEKLNSPQVKAYMAGKRKSLDTLMHAEDVKTDDLHNMRKQIKEIYYLQKIFQPQNKRLNIADDFQELLGRWHDYDVISHKLLTDAQSHKWKPEQVKAIMAIQKKIAAQAMRMLAKIDLTKAKVAL
jgi:CHAD domain-containing protein